MNTTAGGWQTSARQRVCEKCGCNIKPTWTWYTWNGIVLCPFCYKKYALDTPDPKEG